LTLVAPSGSPPDGARDPEPELVTVSSLPSGMRVVTEWVPGVRSASVGVWIGVGSRDETAAQAGAAHYLEHLLFKGTARRTAADIAQEIDAVGGELNAFTGKEHTCFYAHVLDADLPLAVDLLADVVMAATFAPEHVELERAVVLEEIAMRADDPEDLLGEVFDTALYGGHPLGRPVIGSEESIRAMTPARLRGFWAQHYVPSRMVVAAAGNVSHEWVVELVEACFPSVSGERVASSPGRADSAEALTALGGLVLHSDDTEQAHLMLGVPGLARRDPRRPALEVLNTALGGGLSSRLFQRIREERGLAYSVYSGVTCYTDTGQLTVYAGCQPSRLGDVVALARQVIAEVAADGLTEAEVARAKGALRGGLVLGLEDTASRMQRIGRHELDLGHQRTVRQSLELIEAVTPDRVASVAAEVLGQPFTAAVIGPYQTATDLPAALRSLAG
jgi:predicted Zn-dependent peptidase